MAEAAKRVWWQDLVIAAAAAALTLAGVLATASAGYLSKDRELDIQMVDRSLGILRGESTGGQSEMARRFALRALEKYSGVELSDDEFESWVKGGDVPFKAVDSVPIAVLQACVRPGSSNGVYDAGCVSAAMAAASANAQGQ